MLCNLFNPSTLFQMENDKHKLLFAQRKMEFLEDFGDSIAALSVAQESHAKIAAQVKAVAAAKAEEERDKEKEKEIKTIEGRGGGGPGKSANGTTTYR